jgi:hypothetical protein
MWTHAGMCGQMITQESTVKILHAHFKQQLSLPNTINSAASLRVELVYILLFIE